MEKRADKGHPLRVRPLLIVLSGPSGAGKDAVLAKMKELGLPRKFVVTVTTRSRRPGEENGVAYHFVTVEKFQQMITNNELLECANVYGNWYGVPHSEIKDALEKGLDAIVKVDVQGAATIKKTLPGAVMVFLMPPSMDDLQTRLEQRKTESPVDLARRLEAADEEYKRLSLFDYLVINKGDQIDQAVSDIEALITAEKHRVQPREIDI